MLTVIAKTLQRRCPAL